MNILLAFAIFTLIAGLSDPVAAVRIATVQPGSPAASIGLQGGVQISTDADGHAIYDQSGDAIIAVDGREFPVFDNLEQGTPVVDYLLSHAWPNGDVDDPERRQQRRRSASCVSQPQAIPGKESSSFPITGPNITHDPVTAVVLGARRTMDAATVILRGLQGLVQNIANPPVSGPVGIVNAIGQVRSELPPVFLIWFIGLLSANLAVVNVLPFPPLDGGRVAVSLIQAVSGNRVSQAAEAAGLPDRLHPPHGSSRVGDLLRHTAARLTSSA